MTVKAFAYPTETGAAVARFALFDTLRVHYTTIVKLQKTVKRRKLLIMSVLSKDLKRLFEPLPFGGDFRCFQGLNLVTFEPDSTGTGGELDLVGIQAPVAQMDRAAVS